MKKERNEKQIHMTETDELGIRSMLEGVEPDEAARDRMFQNIMKKAQAAGAADRVKDSEAPKAEVIELPKKTTKNRWKLYVPMLAAAGLILTVGMIFFAFYGIDRLSGKQNAAPDHAAEWNADGNHHSEKTDGLIRTDAPQNEAPAEPSETDRPGGAMPTKSAPTREAATGYLSPDDVKHGQSPVRDDPEMNENPASDNWTYHPDSNTYDQEFIYRGHTYRLTRTVGTQMEVAYEPGAEKVLEEKDASLVKWAKKNGTTLWFGEWSPDGENWYYLQNSDSAPEDLVKPLFQELRDNGADTDALE